MQNNQQGFTLLEMLTVISIIGLITNILFAAAFEARLKAQDINSINDVRVVGQALELYQSDNGSYKITGAGWSGTYAWQCATSGPANLDECVRDNPTSGAWCNTTEISEAEDCTSYICFNRLDNIDQACLDSCFNTWYVPCHQSTEGRGFGFINVKSAGLGSLYDPDLSIVDVLRNGGYLNPQALTNPWALDHQLSTCEDSSEFSLFARLENDDPDSILLMENCRVCGSKSAYHNVIEVNRPNFVVYSSTVDPSVACPP